MTAERLVVQIEVTACRLNVFVSYCNIFYKFCKGEHGKNFGIFFN